MITTPLNQPTIERDTEMRLSGKKSLEVGRTAGTDAAKPKAGNVAPHAASEVASVSATLRPALEELRTLPEFDAELVAQLRTALNEGNLPFDVDRLAGLVQQFFGAKA